MLVPEHMHHVFDSVVESAITHAYRHTRMSRLGPVGLFFSDPVLVYTWDLTTELHYQYSLYRFGLNV